MTQQPLIHRLLTLTSNFCAISAPMPIRMINQEEKSISITMIFIPTLSMYLLSSSATLTSPHIHSSRTNTSQLTPQLLKLPFLT